MKLLLVLALTIAAVCGKPLETNSETPIADSKVVADFKEFAEATSKVRDGRSSVLSFMSEIDDEIRPQMMRESANSITVMMDDTKTLADKFDALVGIAQRSADLWKQAAQKYKETHPTSKASAA